MIPHLNANQQVFCIGLGVFHKHVEIAALVKDPGIDELIFIIEFCSSQVLLK
jgi:hypothetical protein